MWTIYADDSPVLSKVATHNPVLLAKVRLAESINGGDKGATSYMAHS